MTSTVLISLFDDAGIGAKLAQQSKFDAGQIEMRHFPDGETYVRHLSDLQGRKVVIFCPLDRPDNKLLPLIFAAQAARELGAAKIGLVTPYLAYMRQDRRFNPGEAVTSECFADLVSTYFDWLVTIDPHLHRHGSLSDIYAIPSQVVHAAPLLSSWIADKVERPLIVGPDSESEQWVAAVAQDIGCPHIVLEKVRYGDREVEIALPNTEIYLDRTPVLLDDIISTARTMIEACRQLERRGMSAPICVGVHGIFADKAYADLSAAGAVRIVTTNTVYHKSNAIDVTELLAPAVKNFCEAFLKKN